jgi:Fur family peroxide stress response transcriptional regulator
VIAKMETVKKVLEDANITPTYQRLSVLKYLQYSKAHPTVDQIYEYLVKEIPTISPTTIYNTLNLFVEKGLVMPLTITGTGIRYDYNTTPHHHFLCKRCGKIIDINFEFMIKERSVIDGNKIEEVHLYFKGICKNCLAKERKNKE